MSVGVYDSAGVSKEEWSTYLTAQSAGPAAGQPATVLPSTLSLHHQGSMPNVLWASSGVWPAMA